MLRSQLQKKGGFYVCASCRRQNLHSLTQLRSRATTPGRAPSSASRLLSSAPARTLHYRHVPRNPRDAAPQTHHEFLSGANRTGVRGYSSYGKFGSGTLPGQTNTDWARAASPPAWGGRKPGGFQAGKIPPAKSTSVAPAKPTYTSMPDTQSSAAQEAPLAMASGQPSAATAIPSDNIAQDRAWQPTEHKPFSPKPGFANRSPIRPARDTSTMGKFKSEASPLPENTPAARGTQENAPEFSQSASGAHHIAQQPEPTDQNQGSQSFTVRRKVFKPPPGAEYGHLRRRSPSVDEFETLSPFNLPGEELPRRSLFGFNRPAGASSGDKSSAVGGSAPAPVDSIASSGMDRSPGLEEVPLEQLDTAQSLSNTESRQTSQPRDPVDQFSIMRKVAAPSRAPHRSGGKQSDWGLSESDLAPSEERYSPRGRERDQGLYESDMASPEERHAQRRRQNAMNQAESRAQGRRRHDSGFDYEEHQARKQAARRRKEEKRAAKEAEAPKTIMLPEYITIFDLAQALGVKPQQFLSDLGELGFENILHDSIMTGETAALVAAEYGLDPVLDTGDDIDLKPRPPPEDPSALPPRPPIVTIMGHVDHGKTTMLDWLRKSSVAAQEHGGITQHIGAFSVRLSSGKVITFLDTPGHAAFLSMRQRGANVTDIVVLVVAVDDSVKPQTLEALKHAQNAKVPIIVAINKIDVDERRIDQVKQDLAANGVEIEDFGGDVQVVGVSGKTGKGMDDLEESILTLSEILDVRAETNGMAEGWILEASVKVDGKAATVLVKRGTIRVGDLIVAGTTYARIRMMRNEAGVNVGEAGPGTPVEVLGWRDAPVAGDLVLQAEDEDRAQLAVDYREELADRTKAAAQKGEEELKNREKAEQEALEKMMEEEGEDAVSAEAEVSGPKTVNTIVRGDVMGSVEAVCTAVMEIGNNEVHARVLRSSPGQINESDIDLMAVAKGCIINFNAPIPSHIKSKAEEKGVRILDHTIIYHLVEDVKEMMSEQLAPIISQKVLAEAEVLQVFSINIVKRKYRNIAGVKVKTGTLTRGGMYRVMRDGEKVFEGKLDALKQGKKDVKEMRRGTECGVSFESWDEFEAGDVIQLFEEVTQKRYL
ncbi:hypothetical protein INS49_013829 [Diaporthe citri]|uniref:uncharacterized protein n=1 Tax=Diaporthe citri TaxID=83186 RepID=UPI001C825F7D|nr:uncharacterized protein INS49_013829 [Diaporthe citri]KAG6357946.1 hypothetical protein INS49_013829 [Diaporthe citri]